MTFFWCLDLGPFCVLNCIRKKKRVLGRDLVHHNVGKKEISSKGCRKNMPFVNFYG